MKYLIDTFLIGTDKECVFKVILNLTLSRYPNMVLTYREGRRREDSFSPAIEQVTEVLFKKIQYSNEWCVHLQGCSAFNESEKNDKSVSFRFLDNKLLKFRRKEAKLLLAPELSSEQLQIIASCQLFIKEIQHQITKPLEDDSWTKMGAAYKTSFCVVGKDMRRGLAIVEQCIKAVDLADVYSVDSFLVQLTNEVNQSVLKEDFADSEGFIQGTIKEVFLKADRLKNKFL